MKKTFIVLFFIFLTANSYGQFNSGIVTYTITRNPVNVFQNDETPPNFKDSKRKIEYTISTLEFTLKFNKKSSLFTINKNLAIDVDEFYTKMAILATRGDRIVYCDINQRLILEQTAFLDKDFIIKSSIDDLKWTLTKEQKRIGDYLCLKATASKEIETHLKEKKIFNYTAWYCPEIPFNFGPYEITGLPGLVLEFSDNTKTYIAKYIKLNKNQISIEIPNKGKIVTKEEFNSIGKKAFEELGH